MSAPAFLTEALETFLRIQDTILDAERARQGYDSRLGRIVTRRAEAFQKFIDQQDRVVQYLVAPGQPAEFTEAMEAMVMAWRESAEYELDQRAQEWGVYASLMREIGGFQDRVKAIEAAAKAAAAKALVEAPTTDSRPRV